MLREGEGGWERMKCQVKRPDADKQHQGLRGSWVRVDPGTPGGEMAPFSFRGLRALSPALVCLTQPIFFTTTCQGKFMLFLLYHGQGKLCHFFFFFFAAFEAFGFFPSLFP